MTDKKSPHEELPAIEFLQNLDQLQDGKYDSLIYVATDFESIPSFPGSDTLKSDEVGYFILFSGVSVLINFLEYSS